ncbi:hypothetical protein NQZ68_013226 [Dissostichus eleginoides]|nr:hypothetical protein NQZ68_013226 [Dissostichus eleginoides]
MESAVCKDESGDPDPGDVDVSVLGGSVCTFLTLLADGVNINRERTREGPQNKKRSAVTLQSAWLNLPTTTQEVEKEQV